MSEKSKEYNPTKEAADFARWEASLQPGERSRKAFEAMEREQREEYADYLRRCGGVPVSNVKP